MQEFPMRKDTRLKSWDYADRACYFVTICTADRACVLGAVSHECGTLGERRKVDLSDIGRAVETAIGDAVARYPSSAVDKYVVMPNHVHLLVGLYGEDVTLGRFIGFLKSAATRSSRQRHSGLTLWQRGFYDHVVRDDADYRRIWEYIDANPARWAEDRYYAA